MHGSIVAFVVFVAILSVAGCSKESGQAVPPGGRAMSSSERLLGFGVTEGSVGYEIAFGEAKRAGIQFIELPQQWDDIESKPGVYDSPFLAMANEVYPAFDTAIVLSLNPVDTTSLRVPAYLQGKALDDAEVVAAFNNFVDFTIAGLPNTRIVAISIGNEVDGNLGDDPVSYTHLTLPTKA